MYSDNQPLQQHGGSDFWEILSRITQIISEGKELFDNVSQIFSGGKQYLSVNMHCTTNDL